MKKRTSPRRGRPADSDRRPTPDRRRQAASQQSSRPHSGRGRSQRREAAQRREETEMPRGRKRGNPNLVAKQKALPAATAVRAAPPPQREVIEIHTTRERKRNA